MQKQGLTHCSVLVVDDSAAARTLFATTLQAIGVGIIHTVPNGVAAIEHLRQSTHATITRTAPPVDLVITEWDMEPIGGMMLTNWIRRHISSPDKFTRIVVMSSDLDQERVERARNSGVNAVFAKPFTINDIRKHVSSVLFSNPPFFKTKTYFGPDRRRHASDVVLEERRRIQKSYSETLGGGVDPNVGCFDLPHYFSEIAAGRSRETIDFRERDQAHQRLARYSEDYAQWILGDVEVLRLAFRLADENPDVRARNMSLMDDLLLRLEREGNAMGYPLITAFAHTLHNAIKTDMSLWQQTSDIFNTALTGLDTVVRQNINGDGGSMGKALHASLDQLNKKLVRLRPMNIHRQGIAHLA